MLNFLTSRKLKFFIIFWPTEVFRISSNSIATSLIVGCFLPFKCKHLFARLAKMMTSSLSLSFFNWSSRISNRWFSFIEWRKYVVKLLSTSDLVEETGFSPVKSSTRTTPKLYTSLFSMNWPVWKYSGSKYPKVP